MRPPPRIIHLTAREGLSSAFMPQVVRPMALVKARGYDVSLVVLTPIGELMRRDLRQRWRKRRREVREHFGLSLTLLPSAPSRAQGLWSDVTMLRLWLGTQTAGPSVLHCRGTQATHVALAARYRAGGQKVVTDCRGIEAPEFLMYRGLESFDGASDAVRRDYDLREQLQRQAAEQSDAVLCVSDAMQREFSARWGIARDRMRTVACCTDTDAGRRAVVRRQEIRARLGLTDRLVVCYSGSAAPWQVLPETLAVFRQIAELRANAHLLVLTTERNQLGAAVTAAGIAPQQVTIASVPHNEVPDHLAAADIGLLLRAGSIVNRVASPMKFAEYISCGVPVMLTEDIGDFSGLVRRERIGCVLPRLGRHAANVAAMQELMSVVSTDGAALRSRCLDVAACALTWEPAIDSICGTYAELTTASRPTQQGGMSGNGRIDPAQVASS